MAAAPFGQRYRKKAEPPADFGPVIDAILRDDAEVARLTQEIKRAQEQLRRACSKEAWQAYLIVEAETNARTDHVSHLLVRYGFDRAGRYPEPRP